MTFEQGLLLFAQLAFGFAVLGTALIIFEMFFSKEEEEEQPSRLHEYGEAYRTLQQRHDREPTTEEIWQEMGL